MKAERTGAGEEDEGIETLLAAALASFTPGDDDALSVVPASFAFPSAPFAPAEEPPPQQTSSASSSTFLVPS